MNRQDARTIAAFQASLRRDESGPLDWWQACRERIDLREPEVQAWEYLATSTPEPPSLVGGHSLCGVPVGLKDIIETRDMPTSWGTRGYLKTPGSLVDAALVALLDQQGALIMGKTVSTEMAFFTPGKTRNPHDLTHTPGGSSSGSAAAVADRMVPLAFGTQTAGSIIRPASYCGVFGFKPTFDLISLAGVKSFSPSLDTLGWFANHIEDISTTFTALTQARDIPVLEGLGGVRVGLRNLPGDVPPGSDTEQALVHAAECLEQAGAKVFPLPLDRRYDTLVEHQKIVMAYEAARTLASEYQMCGHSMGEKLIAQIEQGRATPYASYINSRQVTEELKQAITTVFAEDVDLILAASSMGAAPAGLDATGDPLYCRGWTLLGLPCLNLPLYHNGQGLPVGVQLVADRFQDERLLSIARRLMENV